jgi:dihydrolipoamide dehydrogenase
LVVIGGGVIGVEFASFFASVGVPVTVIEMLDEIIPGIDADIARTARGELAKEGITFRLSAKVTGIDETGVTYTDKDGAEQRVEADVVLMATGRVPNVERLGLEEIGVAVDGRRINIDDRCRTNIPGIYAAGDCTGKILLAHVASRQAEVAVNVMAGKPDRMRYDAIPSVVYSAPEVAAVGLTAAAAEKSGIPMLEARLPMSVAGRFLAENDGRGLIKVVFHAETRVLLGVHMVGGHCSEMIWGACALIESQARIDEIRETVFPHPTVCEVIREAAFAVD